MNKLLVILVVGLLASETVFASSTHLKRVVEPQEQDNDGEAAVKPATRLATEDAAKEADCGEDKPKCGENQAVTISGGSDNEGQQGGEGQEDKPAMSVEDALGPISQWIDDFRKRAGGGQNLYAAAKATVRPLIEKLRRTQQAAADKLAQSNDAIIQHVEESVTSHIYNLLRSTRKKQDAEAAKQQADDEEKEMNREDKERKELRDAMKKAKEAAEGNGGEDEKKETDEKASKEASQAKESAEKEQEKKKKF